MHGDGCDLPIYDHRGGDGDGDVQSRLEHISADGAGGSDSYGRRHCYEHANRYQLHASGHGDKRDVHDEFRRGYSRDALGDTGRWLDFLRLDWHDAELLVEQPTELDPIVNLMAVKAGLSISPVPTR